MKRFYIFIIATVIYAVIDAVWNFAVALPIYDSIYANAGTEFVRKTTIGGLEAGAFVLFFLLIGYANARLAIEPALEAKSMKKAAFNSLVLGLAAYATFAAPLYGLIENWPPILVIVDILIGGALSLITSVITTAIGLKWMQRSA